LFQVDWQHLFLPHTSLIELAIRGSLVYFALFSTLRFLPSRQIGAVGMSDLLVVLLFANAVQNAMVGAYSSITDGFILLMTIVGWSYLFNWLGYRFPRVQRFLTPPPLLLVKDGEILQHNMERGLINKRELMSQLRQQGVHSLNQVKKAYIEGDGRMSVFTHDDDLEDDTINNDLSQAELS
ncbi:MAG TPA: YetF domain-containing protein, partial [Allocoleopsis sp.]